MKIFLRTALIIILYILHQDFWFWRTANPLAFGFIPIGLFYHACFTVVTSVVMWALVKFAWPSHLEEDMPQEATSHIGVQEDDSH